ncbi:MAG TPA: 3-isopropylmalate dehydratase [Candidatus Binatia bacterium]|nr:3-isopropylmalate dehydratase [Candidatus Binatia bacterium]
MNTLRIRGRAWTFGDDVDTDQIVPGAFLDAPIEEQSRHAFESACPEFSRQVGAGTVVVAGANFGCGSSRESAAEVLKHLGVAAVVAESFGRIFFRNAIAIGLPALACPGGTSDISRGDEVDVDLEGALVTNLTTRRTFGGVPLNEMMMSSLRKGGILKLLDER